jgi:hypothetical protein
MKRRKTYKVEFADKELNFLSDEIFEATDNFTARNKAKEITKKRFGILLELYSLVRVDRHLLWRVI